MQSKSLLVAVAAFAVTVTGAQAFGGTLALERADISTEQRTALEEAHELRQAGDKEAARDLLVEAGVDEEVLQSLREAAREARTEIREAVESGDYELFKELIKGAPLEDVIASESDFELFLEAHELRQAGDREGAKAIFDELGLERGPHHGHGHRGTFRGVMSGLTDEQREAVRVARQGNDKEAVKAILEEAGIEKR